MADNNVIKGRSNEDSFSKYHEMSVNEDGSIKVNNTNIGYVSINNSIYEEILGNGIFTGEWEDTINYNNVIIGITSNKNSATNGLQVQWSHDGLGVCDNDEFTIIANKSKVFTFTPARRYFRIHYTNGIDNADLEIQSMLKKGGIKASSHRIKDSIVTDDDAELVKSVLTAKNSDDEFVNIGSSAGGSLKVALEDGQTNARAEVEPLGALKTVTPVRLVGTPFNNGTKDPNFWTETITGSGLVTQAGQITLSTGTTSNSSSQYDSVRKARKVTGTTNQFRMVGRLVTVPEEDNVRRVGCYDDNNGFFFQVNGEIFGVGSRKNGVDTIINNGSFNGNYDSSVLIDTTLRRFVINYTSVSAKFYIDGILLHTITSSTNSILNSLDLSIRMENYNENGNTTDNSFQIRFATILRLGELITNPTYKYIGTATTTTLKYGAGDLHNIVNNDNSGTMTIYDNYVGSGTIIASIDLVKVLGTLSFNAPFSNGLTIVTTGGAKITVTYE